MRARAHQLCRTTYNGRGKAGEHMEVAEHLGVAFQMVNEDKRGGAHSKLILWVAMKFFHMTVSPGSLAMNTVDFARTARCFSAAEGPRIFAGGAFHPIIQVSANDRTQMSLSLGAAVVSSPRGSSADFPGVSLDYSPHRHSQDGLSCQAFVRFDLSEPLQASSCLYCQSISKITLRILTGNTRLRTTQRSTLPHDTVITL